jgi:radical SAM-linked protein
MNPTLFRLRVAYAKQGRGRWLSHLEVQRALMRLVRRSALPVAVTQGFNPHLRLASGPALGVGVAGVREYFDLILDAYLKVTEALPRLQAAAPSLLPVLEIGYVNGKVASLNAAITLQRICATITVPSAVRDWSPALLEAGFQALRARPVLEVEQKGKTKVFDSATHIPKDAVVHGEGETLSIEFYLRISPDGSLRPDALLQILMREIGVDALKPSGRPLISLTRTGLFIEDDDKTLRAPL